MEKSGALAYDIVLVEYSKDTRRKMYGPFKTDFLLGFCDVVSVILDPRSTPFLIRVLHKTSSQRALRCRVISQPDARSH